MIKRLKISVEKIEIHLQVVQIQRIVEPVLILYYIYMTTVINIHSANGQYIFKKYERERWKLYLKMVFINKNEVDILQLKM